MVARWVLSMAARMAYAMGGRTVGLTAEGWVGGWGCSMGRQTVAVRVVLTD
jgi:hypothetical protein